MPRSRPTPRPPSGACSTWSARCSRKTRSFVRGSASTAARPDCRSRPGVCDPTAAGGTNGTTTPCAGCRTPSAAHRGSSPPGTEARTAEESARLARPAALPSGRSPVHELRPSVARPTWTTPGTSTVPGFACRSGAGGGCPPPSRRACRASLERSSSKLLRRWRTTQPL